MHGLKTAARDKQPDSQYHGSPLYARTALFVVFVCLTMLALDARQLWIAREERLRQAATETDNLARSLAQHVQDIFESTDAIVKLVRANIDAEGTAPDAIVRMQRRMRARVAEQNPVQRIFAYNADGNWIASSLDAASLAKVRDMNVADRDYFRYHRDHSADVALVGPPISSRADGSRVVTLTRRLANPDGSFAGVAGASVGLDTLQRFFDRFDIGDSGAVTLVDGRNTILVRRPFDENNIGRDLSHSDFFQSAHDRNSSRGFLSTSIVDGRSRLGSFYRVAGFDMMMFVARDTNEVLAPWRDEARVHLLWLTVALSSVGIAGYGLTMQIRGRARAESLLALSQQTLEQRVTARTDDLQKIVLQRDRLLREVYHRVNNNLQFVDSLIDMEARRIADENVRQRLTDLRHRVFTLALLQQQIMASDDLDTFAIGPFLRILSRNVSDAVGAFENGIGVELESATELVNLDFALPLGMLATELLTGAFRRPGVSLVKLEFRCFAGGDAMLAVQDDAPQTEQRQDTPDSVQDNLISGFIRQLKGPMLVSRQSGTRIEIRMPFPKVA
jgi:two-component sensor histidine kinase